MRELLAFLGLSVPIGMDGVLTNTHKIKNK